MTLDQEKQRIVSDFDEKFKWTGNFGEIQRSAHEMMALRLFLSDSLDALHAAVLMECAEVCHRYVMFSSNPNQINAAEKIQKEILALVPNKDKKK